MGAPPVHLQLNALVMPDMLVHSGWDAREAKSSLDHLQAESVLDVPDWSQRHIANGVGRAA